MGKLPLFSVDLMKLFDNLHPYRRPCIDIADRLIWFDTVAWLVANMLMALPSKTLRRTRCQTP